MNKLVYPIVHVANVEHHFFFQFLICFIHCIVDPSIPNVQVTRLTLMCDQAPGPITMDLTGESHQNNYSTIAS